MSIRRERETEQAFSSWQEEIVAACQSWQKGVIDRRTFLKQVTAVLALSAITPVSLKAKMDQEALTTEWREDPWWTLYEVQEHLFPHTEDSPGAKDIQATLYLKRELPSPWIDREEADFILKGVEWLNDMAVKTQKARFVDLDYEKREAVLRQIEKSKEGQRWLSLLIYYVIEALLTDPVYGGNPDGSGWKWLSHHAGFPRPTEDKVYSKLR
jgi:gluconate 2-dehydrogenase gamma chain